MVQFQSHFVGLYHKLFYSCNQLSKVKDNTVCYCQSNIWGQEWNLLEPFRTQLLPENIRLKARVHWWSWYAKHTQQQYATVFTVLSLATLGRATHIGSFLLCRVTQGGQGKNQVILNGKVSLYCWPLVWLVWNQLHDNWHFCFYL